MYQHPKISLNQRQALHRNTTKLKWIAAGPSYLLVWDSGAVVMVSFLGLWSWTKYWSLEVPSQT